MPIKGVTINATYLAWNTASNAPETGDSANHTCYLTKDGTIATATNSPAEINATNAPGSYKVVLTSAEMTYDSILVSAKSSTANVVIMPTLILTEHGVLPTAATGTAGAVLTSGTSTAQINTDGSGNGYSYVNSWKGSTPNALVSGRVDSNIGAVAASSILQSGDETIIEAAMTAQGYTTTRAPYLDIVHTAIPNVAFATSGGLLTFGNGAGQIQVNGSGAVAANVDFWLGNVPNAMVSGRLDVNVGAVGASSILQSGDETIIEAAMTAQGYTTTRAPYLSNLSAGAVPTLAQIEAGLPTLAAIEAGLPSLAQIEAGLPSDTTIKTDVASALASATNWLDTASLTARLRSLVMRSYLISTGVTSPLTADIYSVDGFNANVNYWVSSTLGTTMYVWSDGTYWYITSTVPGASLPAGYYISASGATSTGPYTASGTATGTPVVAAHGNSILSSFQPDITLPTDLSITSDVESGLNALGYSAGRAVYLDKINALVPAILTVATITTQSPAVFTVSPMSPFANYTDWEVLWLTGNNANDTVVPVSISAFTNSGGTGTFTLQSPPLVNMVVGDTFYILDADVPKALTLFLVNGIGTDNKVLLSANAQTGVTIPTVTTLTTMPSDPWATALPGSYLTGSAGKLLSSTSTYAGGDTAGTTTLLTRVGSVLPNLAAMQAGLPTDASIKTDVGTALTSQGFTTTRAPYLDLLNTNLNATITSRMATWTPPTGFLSTAFPVGTVGTSTYAGADTSGTTTLLTRVPGTVQPQTGDSYARLGAPSGASIDADILTRSTYAGADTPGTTTLLTRVTGAVPTTASMITALKADSYFAALLANVNGSFVFTPPVSFPGSGVIVIKDYTNTTTLLTVTLTFDSNKNITARTCV